MIDEQRVQQLKRGVLMNWCTLPGKMNTNGNAVNCSFQQCGMEAACSEQQNLCVEDGGTTQRTLRLQPSSYNSVPATTRVSCIEVLLLLVRGSGLDKVLILYRKQMGKKLGCLYTKHLLNYSFYVWRRRERVSERARGKRETQFWQLFIFPPPSSSCS